MPRATGVTCAKRKIGEERFPLVARVVLARGFHGFAGAPPAFSR